MITYQTETVRPAVEIGSLARLLTTRNQSCVLQTIHAFLFAQQGTVQAEQTGAPPGEPRNTPQRNSTFKDTSFSSTEHGTKQNR